MDDSASWKALKNQAVSLLYLYFPDLVAVTFFTQLTPPRSPRIIDDSTSMGNWKKESRVKRWMRAICFTS